MSKYSKRYVPTLFAKNEFSAKIQMVVKIDGDYFE